MKSAFGITALFLLLSCTDHGTSGSEILPKTEMTKVLWDMIQVDEFASMYLISDSARNLKNEQMKLYKQVFMLHKISEKEFLASYKYYSTHPVDMKEIFDTLNVRAERERTRAASRVDTLR